MDQLLQRHRFAKNLIPLTVYRIVALQMLTVVVTSLIWFYFSRLAAFSAFLGGISVVLPSLYLAWRLSSRSHARQIRQIVTAFYLGEAVKLVLTSALVILFIQLFMVSLGAFFCGFVIAELGVWLAFLVMY